MRLLTIGLLAGTLSATSLGTLAPAALADDQGGARKGRNERNDRRDERHARRGDRREHDPAHDRSPGHECEACRVELIPGHFEKQTQQVWQPAEWVMEEVEEKVPGHYETKTEMVTIPAHYDKVERQVWVAGYFLDPRTGQRIEGGRRTYFRYQYEYLSACGQPDRPRLEWVPGRYETVCEQVLVPARCVEKRVQVWVPERCVKKTVPVYREGRFVEKCVEVWVEARYEIVCRTDGGHLNLNLNARK